MNFPILLENAEILTKYRLVSFGYNLGLQVSQVSHKQSGPSHKTSVIYKLAEVSNYVMEAYRAAINYCLIEYTAFMGEAKLLHAFKKYNTAVKIFYIFINIA